MIRVQESIMGSNQSNPGLSLASYWPIQPPTLPFRYGRERIVGVGGSSRWITRVCSSVRRIFTLFFIFLNQKEKKRRRSHTHTHWLKGEESTSWLRHTSYCCCCSASSCLPFFFLDCRSFIRSLRRCNLVDRSSSIKRPNKTTSRIETKTDPIFRKDQG